MTRTKSSTTFRFLFLLLILNLKIYHVIGTEEEYSGQEKEVNERNILNITKIISNHNPNERNHNETLEQIEEIQDQFFQKNDVEPLKKNEEIKQNKTLLQKFNPKEITFHIIFQFLNPFDICQVTKVCKSFYECYVTSAAEEIQFLKEKRNKILNQNEEKEYKHNDFCHYSFFDKKIFEFRGKQYTEYIINQETYTQNSEILPKSIFQMFFIQHTYKRIIPLKRKRIYIVIDVPVRHILYRNKCLSVRFDNQEKFSRTDNSIFRLRLDVPLVQTFLDLGLNPSVGIMYEQGGEEHMRLAENGNLNLDFSIHQCPHEVKTIILDDYMTYLKLLESEERLIVLGTFKNAENNLYEIREIVQTFGIRQLKGQNLSKLEDIIFVTTLGEKKFSQLS